MMKVLLTGASGLVGSNLKRSIESAGYELLSPSSKELDLKQQNVTLTYLTEHKPDVVIHSAGKVGGIKANIAQPVEFLLDNTLMGVNLVNAALTCGVPKFINLASSCMYPKLAENPLAEEQVLTGPLEPTNEGYALAKITVARLCGYINDTRPELQYTTLVPCNLYGPNDNFDLVTGHMIPSVIRKLHEAKENAIDVVDIWGDGEARREFMYVEDLAESVLHILKLSNSCDNNLPNMMNVGINKDYSINDYYQTIAQVVGYEGRFEHDLTKPTGMKQKLIDSSLINQLGWQSTTDLKLGIEKTYQYYLEHVNNV